MNVTVLSAQTTWLTGPVVITGGFCTVVLAVDELFALTKSNSSACTDAVFTSVPLAVGVNATVTVADAWGAIEPPFGFTA